MSPIALKLLTMAFKNYLKTGDQHYNYLSPTGTDFIYAIEAVRQLYKDNYIDNLPASFLSNSIPSTFLSVDFSITEKGIKFMQSNGQL